MSKRKPARTIKARSASKIRSKARHHRGQCSTGCLDGVHRERRERPRGRRRTRLEQRYRRPQSHLANLRLAQAFPNVRERTTGDAAQPARCVLGLAFFINAAGLEFREPSAEFGQLGRREPQDRFLDIFDCHGRRNSTPASELEEPWLANRDVTVFRRPLIEVGKQGPHRQGPTAWLGREDSNSEMSCQTNGTSRIWSSSHFRREAFAVFS